MLLSVQPRIRLTRSFDVRSHSYLGYSLRVRGRVENEAREFLLGVGQGAHAKHQFQAGTVASGYALPVPDPLVETAEFYGSASCKSTDRRLMKRHRNPRGTVFHRPLRSTASAVIRALPRAPFRPSARAASGDAGWRSR